MMGEDVPVLPVCPWTAQVQRSHTLADCVTGQDLQPETVRQSPYISNNKFCYA
jgi:hypothetical protein